MLAGVSTLLPSQGNKIVFTHSSDDAGLSLEAAVELDLSIVDETLNNLATGDGGVGLVCEDTRQELGGLGEGRAVVGAVEDVVAQDGLDEVGLSKHLGSGGIGTADERVEGAVAGGQDGNVGKLANGTADGSIAVDQS